jgi:PAS domain S-box-containing protein
VERASPLTIVAHKESLIGQNDLSASPPVNILLVDDQLSNLLALEAVLEPMGQNLVRASSGSEALKWLLNHDDCAVILLDVQMPILDGFETAGLIKERESSRHIPIIFVTATSSEERFVLQSYAASAVDYIVKPFGPEILKAKVAVFVELFQKAEELKHQISGRRGKERHVTEAQSHLSEFKSTLDATLDGVFMIDAHSLHFSYINHGGVGQLGYEREEVLTLTPFDVLPEVDSALLSEKLNALRDGTLPSFTFQTRQRRKDGSMVPVELFMQFVAPEQGAGRFVAVARDITDRKLAEEELQLSEEMYRSLALATAQIVWTTDADGMMEDIPAWRAFTGQSTEEVQGWGWIQALHPSDRERVSDIRDHCSEIGIYETEYNVRGRDGNYRLFGVRGVPILKTDGSARAWVGTFTDIHDQRQAEEERDRFFTLSLDMLAIIGSDGYFRRVNPAWEVTLGFTDAELMAVPFLEFVHPDDRDATIKEDAKLLRGGELMRFENRYRCRDGSYKWLLWMCSSFEDLIYCVAHDITSVKESATALLQANDYLEVRVEERTAQLARSNEALQIQITEREDAEAEIRVRARQQEAVAELGRQALTDIDIDNLLHGATQLVTATLDVELSSVLELMPCGDTLCIRASTGWNTNMSSHLIPATNDSQSGFTLRSKSPTIVADFQTETRFPPSQRMVEHGIISGMTVIIGNLEQPFGTLGAYSVRSCLFPQDAVHFLQSIANVLAAALEQRRNQERLIIENEERQKALSNLQKVTTGLKEAKEEAEQARESADAANLAKSEFLSRMSHELRTPLNAILGFGQILERQDSTPRSRESIAHILKGGRHLLDLINEVLEIARVEAGHTDFSLEPIDLADAIPDTCSLVRPLAAERNICLKVSVPERGHSYILADLQRLKQVLINLLSNAIKYNRVGGRVEVSCTHKIDGWISIAVRDTGPGISPQDLPKIFTPFERLNASASTVEGTGLGLSLSLRLVIAMGGTLTVKSTLGQGTTFTLELPDSQPSELQLTNIPREKLSIDKDTQTEATYCVLCIEDNPSNLRLIEAIFEDRPEITLLAAIQGSVGLDLARQHEPDLILLDLDLPDIKGNEVLTRLQRSAVTRQIPVVIVSADATPTQIERLLTAGAKAYLTKPLDVRLFLKTVDQFLL